MTYLLFTLSFLALFLMWLALIHLVGRYLLPDRGTASYKKAASCSFLAEEYASALTLIDEDPTLGPLGAGRLQIQGVVGLERVWRWLLMLPFVAIGGFFVSILDYISKCLDTIASFSVAGLLASSGFGSASTTVVALVAIACLSLLAHGTDNHYVVDLVERQLIGRRCFFWHKTEQIVAAFDAIDGVGLDSCAVPDPDTGKDDYYVRIVVLMRDGTTLPLGMRSDENEAWRRTLETRASLLGQLLDSNVYPGAPGVRIKRHPTA